MRVVLLVYSFFWVSALSAQPQVVQVSPTPNTIAAAADASILIHFNQSVDASSVSPQSVRVFGRWSGVATGTLTVTGAEVRFTPDRPLFAGEWVTVSLSRAITSGGVPLAKGYAWNYWVRTAPASLALTESRRFTARGPGDEWIQVYGAYAGDLNRDGWSDLTVINEQAHHLRVFLNDGAGDYQNYTEYALPNESFPSPNEGADFNGDGAIDLVVAAAHGRQLTVLMGDGQGGFEAPQVYFADNGVRGVGVLDLDGDGHDDIVTTHRQGSNMALFMNQGDGTMAAPIMMEPGTEQETAAAVADANGDGIMDVFIGAYASEEILLLLGDGEGGLVVSDRKAVQGRPWMIAAGDLNGDGFADVVSGNSTGHNAAVLLSDGTGGLLEAVTYATGAFPVAMDVGDLDGDGDLDFVTSNYQSANWTLYENAGNGTFINPRTLSASGGASCAILHDRDNDGDLDLTGTDEVDDLLFFFDNASDSVDTETVPQFSARLEPSYPNPFRERTTLTYSLDSPALVRLEVYDMLGRSVKTLVHQMQAAGPHTALFEADGLPPGWYVYRLQTDTGIFSQPVLLIP